MSLPSFDDRRRRILFVAEAVTLAHVARPLALASRLDKDRYEVTFASEPRFGQPWLGQEFSVRPIRSITSEQFLDSLAKGRPVYDARTLESYVGDDLAILKELRPDVIVGDFRLSLSISARIARIPYLAITNAYWSPFATGSFPMPELPLSKHMGIPLGSLIYRLFQPLAFALHSRPLNQVRRAHGFPGLGSDLRRVYTDADHTLYADVPELFETWDLPPTHHYLGPIGWSPDVDPPEWWDNVPDDRPIIYTTLGSSGRPELLSHVLEALADLPVTVLAASAGKRITGRIPPNARVAPYLPGREAARRSSLVICNGGSPTTHQALAVGTPVLGLASNLDQHLNMRAIVERGAGVLVRAELAHPELIRESAKRILADSKFRTAADELSQMFARYDPHERFECILDKVLENLRTGRTP